MWPGNRSNLLIWTLSPHTTSRHFEWGTETSSDEIIDELEPVKRGIGGAVGYTLVRRNGYSYLYPLK